MKKLLIICIVFSCLRMLSGCDNSRNPAAQISCQGVIQNLSGPNNFTGYQIYAQAKSNYRLYYAPLAPDGSFSLGLPGSESYILTLIGSDSHVAGVISPGPSGAGLVIIGLKSSGDKLDLGTLTLDPNTGIISASRNLDDSADPALTARLVNGRLAGFGNLGKGLPAVSAGALRAGNPDLDADGLIDSLDADADGNGVVDELQGPLASIQSVSGDPSSEDSSFALTKAGKPSDCIRAVGVFMNLKIPYERSGSFDLLTDMVLTLELIPDSDCVDTIEKIEVLNGPQYLDVTTIAPLPRHWSDGTDPAPYPSPGTLWKDSSYNLYKVTPSGDSARWSTWVVPHAQVTAGDSFHFKVTYASGPVEHFLKMVDYVFTDIPRLTAWNGNPAPAPVPGGPGAPSNLLLITGDPTLAWRRPLDENGTEITGMSYLFRIFLTVGNEQKEEKICATIPDGGGVLTTTLPASCLPLQTSGGENVTAYQVDLTASSPAGDNSAQLLNLKR